MIIFWFRIVICFLCRMCKCQCAFADVWRHSSLLVPNLWGAIESIREKSCWGRCLSSGNRQTRISDSIFTCNSQTSLYREQLHMETLWSTMCASWRLCSQSQSCNEITSPSWRFWLPLHVWGASSEMFLDTDVRSGPKSWNTWTLCTIRLCQI